MLSHTDCGCSRWWGQSVCIELFSKTVNVMTPLRNMSLSYIDATMHLREEDHLYIFQSPFCYNFAFFLEFMIFKHCGHHKNDLFSTSQGLYNFMWPLEVPSILQVILFPFYSLYGVIISVWIMQWHSDDFTLLQNE